jgi:hypothetical protein
MYNKSSESESERDIGSEQETGRRWRNRGTQGPGNFFCVRTAQHLHTRRDYCNERVRWRERLLPDVIGHDSPNTLETMPKLVVRRFIGPTII